MVRLQPWPRRARRTIALALTALTAAALFAAVLLGKPSRALAQAASAQAAAEALFKQGRDLMAAGRLSEACPKFAESERLDPAPGTLLNLATCYERNGQLASAWVTYKEAASLAQTADQQDRARLARQKAGELETKLPTLTIVVPPSADRPDLTLKRDGDVVGRPGWGTPIPVDPGAHVIEASAPGRKTWQGQSMVDGPGVQASIEVPPLEASPAPPSVSGPTPAGVPSPATGDAVRSPPSPEGAAGRGSALRTVAFVVGGVGVGGLIAGSIFGVIAKSNNDDAKTHCLVNTACDSEGMSSTTTAKHDATASTIAFAAGAGLVAAGVVLYLVAPSESSRTTATLRLSPLLGDRMGGAAVRGSW